MPGDVRVYQTTVSGRDAHLDVPLTNVAVKAFQSTEDFLATKICPPVPVINRSNKYYVLDPNSWLQVPVTLREAKTSPRRVEWKVSSDAYYCNNYALAGENALEDLANADAALRLRENTTGIVTEALLRDMEVRVANLVTSISNLGSGVVLSATAWSNYPNSDPIADITSGHAFIRQRTGLMANTLMLDVDTYMIVRRHPLLLDMYKYSRGGYLTDAELSAVFMVDTLLLGRGIKNNAPEAATPSITNIWGNNALLARVVPGLSLQTATFGLAFQWTPEGLPGPMAVERYEGADPGAKVEVIAAGYWQQEKIIAPNLAYLINATL